MFKKSIILALFVAQAGLTIGCKSDSKKNDPQPPPPVDPGGNGPNGVALDLDSIVNNNFFSQVSFDFSEAVSKKQKVLAGTKFETEVRRHSFFFNNQQIIKNEKKAKDLGEYCEFYIDTPLQVKGHQIELEAGTKLKVGQVSTFKNNQDVEFNIVLQATFSEQFQLSCLNVKNVDEVNSHIGHILLITKDNKPFPQQPKIQQIGFYDDNFGFIFSKGGSFVVLNATLWGKKLSKSTAITDLAWRLCDTSTGKCITEWQFAMQGTKMFHPGEVAFSFEIKDKQQVNKLIKNMKSLELQLSVDASDVHGPVVTHVLDLGGYCQTNSNNFVNADFNQNGCTP